MAITARLKSNITSIKASVTSGGVVTTQQPTLTLKNTLKDEISLDQLVNVVEGTPTDGDTLVYNSTLNKYEVKSITGLDGGVF